MPYRYQQVSMTRAERARLKAMRDARPSMGEQFLTGAVFPAIGQGLGYAAKKGLDKAFEPEPVVDEFGKRPVNLYEQGAEQPIASPVQMQGLRSPVGPFGAEGMNVPQVAPMRSPVQLNKMGQFVAGLGLPTDADYTYGDIQRMVKDNTIAGGDTRLAQGATTARADQATIDEARAATTEYDRGVTTATTAAGREAEAETVANYRQLVRDGMSHEQAMARVVEQQKAPKSQAYTASKRESRIGLAEAKGNAATAYEQFNRGELNEEGLLNVLIRESEASGKPLSQFGMELEKQDDGSTKWVRSEGAETQFPAQYAKEALERETGETAIALKRSQAAKAAQDKKSDELAKSLSLLGKTKRFADNELHTAIRSASPEGSLTVDPVKLRGYLGIDNNGKALAGGGPFSARIKVLINNATTPEEVQEIARTNKLVRDILLDLAANPVAFDRAMTKYGLTGMVAPTVGK